MSYLILQIWICLLIAAIAGFILGWLLKSICATKRIRALETERDKFMEKTYDMEASASSKAVGDVAERKDIYDITEIEGIGKGYGKKLGTIGIETTNDLLEMSKTDAGIKRIAGAVNNIEPFVIKKWVSMADLIRVAGIRGQFAELLEVAGVKSVSNLTEQNAKKLTATMIEINDREHRTRTNPTEEMVQNWINGAKKVV